MFLDKLSKPSFAIKTIFTILALLLVMMFIIDKVVTPLPSYLFIPEYVLATIALMKVFNDAGRNIWIALVPLWNLCVILKITGRSDNFILVAFATVVLSLFSFGVASVMDSALLSSPTLESTTQQAKVSVKRLRKEPTTLGDVANNVTPVLTDVTKLVTGILYLPLIFLALPLLLYIHFSTLYRLARHYDRETFKSVIYSIAITVSFGIFGPLLVCREKPDSLIYNPKQTQAA